MRIIRLCEDRPAIPFIFLLFSFIAFPSGADEKIEVLRSQNVCISCHLEQEDELKDVIDEWMTSIHFRNGISCEACHGGDPKDEDISMDPDEGFVGVPDEKEIPSFCGKCHVAVKENYLKSAHGLALEGEVPNCVTCHTAHEQQRATLDLINEKQCSRCHAFDRAHKIQLVMSSSERTITTLTSKIHNLTIQTIDTRRLEEELFSTRNTFHRLTHVLSVDKIVSELGAIEENLMKIENTVRENEGVVKRRKMTGLAVVVILILSGFLMGIYRNIFD